MTIEDLIAILKHYQEENGNLPVYIIRKKNERSVPILEIVNGPMTVETEYAAITFPAETRLVIR